MADVGIAPRGMQADDKQANIRAQAMADLEDARSALALVVDALSKAISDTHPVEAGALRAADRAIASALADLRAAG